MNISNLYEKNFDDELKSIFKTFSAYGKIYLVGGIVRDILLNKKNADIDLVVEGDAIEFCKKLGDFVEIISIHDDFKTVKVKVGDYVFDIASTRNEVYPVKGGLPKIIEVGCDLKKDVLRRDFTINSLALDFEGNLIDFASGFEDLQNKKLRILHENSFVDDLTRILRGIKFELRFNFELEDKTKQLQDDFLNNLTSEILQQISYKRVKDELFDVLSLEGGFEKLVKTGAYKMLVVEKPNAEFLKKFILKKRIPIFYLGILTQDEALLDKLELTAFEKNIILEAKKISKLQNDIEIYRAFENKSYETIMIYSVLNNFNPTYYFKNLQKIKLEITGDDLISLGFKPSEEFRNIFNFVLSEKFKNPNLTKNDEINLVKKKFNL